MITTTTPWTISLLLLAMTTTWKARAAAVATAATRNGSRGGSSAGMTSVTATTASPSSSSSSVPVLPLPGFVGSAGTTAKTARGRRRAVPTWTTNVLSRPSSSSSSSASPGVRVPSTSFGGGFSSAGWSSRNHHRLGLATAGEVLVWSGATRHLRATFSTDSSSSSSSSDATSTSAEDSSSATTTRPPRPSPILYPPTFDPDDYTLHHPPSCPHDSHVTGILPSSAVRPGRRVVSFGDVHGDLHALIAFLITAGVMKTPTTTTTLDEALRNPTWTGGDTILVQVGDVLDRGGNELGCLRLLSRLSRRATEDGGAVHLLYGNHEALNACGLFQYAYPEGNAEFELVVGGALDRRYEGNRWRLQFAGNQAGRWAAFEPGGLLGENVLGRMKVCMVVGRTVFVHAGLTAEHVREYYYDDDGKVGVEGGKTPPRPSAAKAVEEMNRAARDWVLKVQHGECNHEGNYTSMEQVLKSANARAKSISDSMPSCLGGGIGRPSPVWMRDYSQPADVPPKNPHAAQRMIDDALRELGELDVRRMVVGHTPQSRINAALKGRAWRVDVGASRGVAGGTPEVLEIVHGGDDEGEDEVHVLTPDGRRIPGRERHAVEDVPYYFD